VAMSPNVSLPRRLNYPSLPTSLPTDSLVKPNYFEREDDVYSVAFNIPADLFTRQHDKRHNALITNYTTGVGLQRVGTRGRRRRGQGGYPGHPQKSGENSFQQISSKIRKFC